MSLRRNGLGPKLGRMEKFAVLWDWDGVVIDSSRQHEESWELLAEEEDLPLPDNHFELSFGKKNAVIIPEILDWTRDPGEVRRLALRKEALYREILEREGRAPDLIPGVVDILRALRQAGCPSVIGTSTDRENVELIFRLLGLREFFRDMVSSEDVTRGKPDPEVFLKAAARAGLPPERCIVCEDSLHGIQAGRAGGMRVIGVSSSHPEAKLREAGAHRVVPDFRKVDLEFMRGLFADDTGIDQKVFQGSATPNATPS